MMPDPLTIAATLAGGAHAAAEIIKALTDLLASSSAEGRELTADEVADTVSRQLRATASRKQAFEDARKRAGA